jgi:hypothetical protein
MAARKDAARLVITPEALSLVLAVWSGQIEKAREQNDIRSLQSLLRQFVTKIELGHKMARIWYNYPIDAFVIDPESTFLDNKKSGPLVSFRFFYAKALLISWSK